MNRKKDEVDFWLTKERQLIVNTTTYPVHVSIDMWEKRRGFYGLLLKKKEVAWLIKRLTILYDKMVEEKPHIENIVQETKEAK